MSDALLPFPWLDLVFILALIALNGVLSMSELAIVSSREARLKAMASEKLDIPLVIGGKEIRTGRTAQSVMPHDHKHVLADYHLAGPEHVQQAIAAAAEARREWGSWPWEDRAAVMLRAAEMLATTLDVEFDPDSSWDEKKQIYRISNKIVRTMNITQSAVGSKRGLWTTVIAAAILIFD